jgi:hypothetical protein
MIEATESEDDEYGAVAYLAPEIVALKDWKKHATTKQPPPCGNCADDWAPASNTMTHSVLVKAAKMRRWRQWSSQISRSI